VGDPVGIYWGSLWACPSSLAKGGVHLFRYLLSTMPGGSHGLHPLTRVAEPTAKLAYSIV